MTHHPEQRDAKRKPNIIKRIGFDGRRLLVVPNYLPSFNRVFKGPMYEGWWCHPRRAWCYLPDKFPALVSGLEEMAAIQGERCNARVPVQAINHAMQHALHNPDPDLVAPFLNIRLFPVDVDGTIGYILSNEYDRLIQKAIHAIHGQYDREARVTYLFHVSIQEIMDALASAGVQPDHVYVHPETVTGDRIEELLNDEHAALDVGRLLEREDGFPVAKEIKEKKQRAEIVTVIDAQPEPRQIDERVLNMISSAATLYPFQTDGVRKMLSRPGAFNCDDMGLGKTRQAICSALYNHVPAIIAAPAFLKDNWAREIASVAPNARCHVMRGRGDYRPDADFLIVNYELLEDLAEKVEHGLGHYRQMFLDEGHYVKNLKAGRTGHVLRLVSNMEYRYILTGTPVLNNERELHTLLTVVGHPLGQISPEVFAREFTGTPILRRRLNRAISDWMVRRMKTEILTDFSQKHYLCGQMKMPDAVAREYQALMSSEQFDNPLAKLTYLRQFLEQSRIEWTVNRWLKIQERDPDAKALFFTQFKATARALMDRFAAVGSNPLAITGDYSQAERLEAESRFQNDERHRVLVATAAAAGVGLTLTRANHVVTCSLPLVPGIQDQAEDRAWRLPQKKDVFVHIPLYGGTLDVALYQLLEIKRRKAAQTLDSGDHVAFLMGEGREQTENEMDLALRLLGNGTSTQNHPPVQQRMRC